MAGLDEMIGQIRQEAGRSADEVLENAGKEAELIRQESEKICRGIIEEAEKTGEREAEKYICRSRSAAVMEQKNALLKFKQDIIDQVIQKTIDELRALETDEYFKLILHMVKRYARGESGKILFSSQDMARLPEGFSDELSKAAAARGGELKAICYDGRLDGGFILSYGGIEMNCSFDAMIRTEQDALKDILNDCLFKNDKG